MVSNGSTPAPRNAERVMYLASTGLLPPELRLPDVLHRDLSSTYPMWFRSLPARVRNELLPYLYNCELSEQLHKVGGGGWGPRAPFSPQCTGDIGSPCVCL